MPNFKHIAVVGMGLIGSSLAAAFKKYRAEIEITAVDISKKSIEKAENLGLIDQGFVKIDGNLKKADLIFLAVPVRVIPEIIKKIKILDNEKQLIVDTGSSKKEIMLKAADVLANSSKIFIGGHPMAGSHKSGIDWYETELFKDAPFILTPWIKENTSSESQQKIIKKLALTKDLEKLKSLLISIGSKVYIISAEKHDHCTAYLSHLPHLLASALVNLSTEKDFDNSYLNLSGSGYRDMTRIAAGSAELWQDIIISNSKNLTLMIKKYIKELEKIQKDLATNDQEKIYDFLTRAAEIKKQSRENN